MIQLFKSQPNKEAFIEFIKTHTNKERNYYKITNDIYKQMVFKEVIAPFLENIRPHYHISKQFYLCKLLKNYKLLTSSEMDEVIDLFDDYKSRH